MEITKEYSVELGGEKLIAQFSDITDQANGSVVLRCGETVVLATAVMSSQKREGIDYFPLTVDYEEKFYAAGQILGSRFMKREGKPSDEAVLSGRAIDRTIRPLFDSTIRNEVQVVITVLSLGEYDPDVLGIMAASVALATSDIPWNGPISAVRLGWNKESGWTIHPKSNVLEDGTLKGDILVCGLGDSINMIELGTEECSEKDVDDAFAIAIEEIKKLQAFQEMIIKDIGKEKTEVERLVATEVLETLFKEKFEERLFSAVFSGGNVEDISKEWMEATGEENGAVASIFFEEQIDKAVHKGAIENNKRVDGRGFDEIRPLKAFAGGVSPALHGTGTFYRGGTHVLSALTLGGPQDSQVIDGMEIQTKKRFMHHYNFPPFSTGETGRMGGVNRRMVGHGALAEKALLPVIPSVDMFPYTIRIVSEVMASNGSSSMASVCGSTLSLMDAGVPIKEPVAGIAMGLITGGPEYRILTDIQGPEDHYGDMDLKVAGTRNGITAIQMDVKVDGVSASILSEAIQKARDARLQILDVIQKVLPEPRSDISPRAPRIIQMTIHTDQIGLVIGSGGKTINAIKEFTQTEIDIEDNGMVFITGKNGGAEQAKEIIDALVREYKKGDRLEGKVSKVLDFGAFVEFGGIDVPGITTEKEGLVHISEIAPFRIQNVADVLHVGDEVSVIVKEVDERGRINLSIKNADGQSAKRKGVSPTEGADKNGK